MLVRTLMSNHHVHLTKADTEKLFGSADALTVKSDLGGEYASNEMVEVIGPKGSFTCRVVFGGYHDITQVEVLRADNRKLGIDAPVRLSGSKDGLAEVTIKGPKGEITGNYAMIAWRHIHVGGKTLEGTPFEGASECQLKVGGDRGLTFDHVSLRTYPGVAFDPFCHLDTEEGNAACINNGDMLEMIPYEN